MALKIGDKCPVCKQGLLERTELGITCSECSFDMVLDEVLEANERDKVKAGEYVFKPKTFKITIDDPEQGEEFLRGLIVARSNNSSEYFVDLIDLVNTILEPWRTHRLQQEMMSRG